MNPTLHHPSWYHLIGQLSKDELATTVAGKALSVTPASSSFKAPLFSIACDKKQWRVKTRHKDAHLRILELTVKSFDDLLSETLIKQFAFTFAFSLNLSHTRLVDFLIPRTQSFINLDADGAIATTLVNTSTAEAVRRRKVHLYSAARSEAALLSVGFTYPLLNERMFSLRQLSMIENYELDYDEALATADHLAITLMESRTADGSGKPPPTLSSN